MIERFKGAEGARRLVDALLQQGALQGDHDLAEALALLRLRSFPLLQARC